MRFDVVTLFPNMFAGEGGVINRAFDKRILDLNTWNPRDFTQDRHRTVDDRPYGGGPGMVMLLEPMRAAIQAAVEQSTEVLQQVPRVIHLSPQGRRLDQNGLRHLARSPNLVLVCSRYEGMDERLTAYIDEEWSIGDYVLSGGELAAMVLIDGVARLLPGVLGDAGSAQQDSFMNGLLDYPHYTRPEVVDGMAVPPVLLSGNHEQIERWRQKQALGNTWIKRPELLQDLNLTDEQQQLLEEFKAEYEQSKKIGL
ncbi:MAG: tRNA (guanosine(37)-N1)-methyltransferase TrmD [Gammaproteobacteria bacterium]|nr:tRNA (guanosine(37)-N1)-methyltransferase TrmD [Gammaproteobacteria bacterium]MDH5801069.1 tRNA (guanosine(37)-N1)-methyltransferase TrmD [Gammaproteobacteria bacterium]